MNDTERIILSLQQTTQERKEKDNQIPPCTIEARKNRERVQDILLSTQVTKKLTEEFWVGKQAETNSNQEVNSMEIQLAELFWKKEEIKNLEVNTLKDPPLTMKNVLNQLAAFSEADDYKNAETIQAADDYNRSVAV